MKALGPKRKILTRRFSDDPGETIQSERIGGDRVYRRRLVTYLLECGHVKSMTVWSAFTQARVIVLETTHCHECGKIDPKYLYELKRSVKRYQKMAVMKFTGFDCIEESTR